MAKKKMGAPIKEINWAIVDGLFSIQCTQDEICEVLNISDETLKKNIKQKFGMTYLEYSAQKGAGGRVSLRRKQFQVANSGNVAMLIFLGKQYLGQSDKVTNENNNRGAQVVVMMPHNGRDEEHMAEMEKTDD